MSAPAIHVRDLSKSYGDVRALREVSLSLPRGVSGLIGPNGAGKTTLIKILVGLLRQDSGEARILGLDAHRDREVLSRVSVLHEKPSPPPWASGREYLEHVARMRGVEDPAGEVAKVSEWLEVSPYLDRRISGYSAGMVQRISLAAALIGDPELVILDEPTANLDPLGRMKVLSLIKRLWRDEGTSFLISTHILSELEDVCGSVALLNEGRVVECGDVRELREVYGSYTLSFEGKRFPGLAERFEGLEGVEVLVEDGLVRVRSKKEDLLLRELAGYLRAGGRASSGVELRSSSLSEVFANILSRGEPK